MMTPPGSGSGQGGPPPSYGQPPLHPGSWPQPPAGSQPAPAYGPHSQQPHSQQPHSQQPHSQPGANIASQGALYVARYELLLELAAGGMGSVYVGRQRGAGGFERVVAIKRMHPHLVRDAEFALAFHEEARIASLIHHPNVVNVVDVYEDAGEHLIVMEYIEGTSVNGLLIGARREASRLPRAVAIRIAIDALHGLHAAHEQRGLDGTPLQVVHRDVSPQNILVGIDGSVRLTDFGIARAVERLVHTSTGQLKGKLRYMPPEQALGERIDRRADIFALGIVLWEMLSGDRFYQGDSELDILRSVAEARIQPLSHIDPSTPAVLDQILSYALAPRVDQRFPTAQAFANALERYALDARDTATSADVAQLVLRLEGERIQKRRSELKDALTGRRSLGARGLPAVQLGTPTVGPSVSVIAGPATQRNPGGPSTGLYVGLATLALVVGVGSGVLIYGTTTKPKSGDVVVQPAPAAQPSTISVRLNADRAITEVRAAGATEIVLDGSSASFALPLGEQPIPVEIAFEDGSNEKLSVTPNENVATRLTSVRAPAPASAELVAATASASASAAAAPAAPGARRPRLAPPATAASTAPSDTGLKKNPYQ